MIPIWIFGFFMIAFIAVIIWERYDYRKLMKDYESATYFLDLYISKFGPTITDEENDIEYIAEAVDDTDNVK